MSDKFTKSVIADGERLRDFVSGDLIATVWPRNVAEVRKSGESWLDMRIRTDPAREAAQVEVLANARLYAAAPDLLAALQALLNVVGNITTEYPTGYDGDRAEAMACDAIEKATGVKP